MVQTVVRKEWEARYVSEYLVLKFPDAVTHHRVPLGDIPAQLQQDLGPATSARWFRPSRPVADAIAVLKGTLYLIEGKIFNPNTAIGQLLFYSRLLKHTPELKQYADLPVRLQLVTAREPPWASHIAEFPGIEIIIFQPAWMDEYYAHLQSYWSGEKRATRQQRKDRLTSLGWTHGA